MKNKLTLTLSILSISILCCTNTFAAKVQREANYYDIYQENNKSEANPYKVCMGLSDCPQRTTKELEEPKVKNVVQINDAMPDENSLKVYFDFNSFEIFETENKNLISIVPEISKFKSIILRGWTDPVGGDKSKANIALAKQRANTVKEYLIKQGIKGPINIEYSPPCCNSTGSANSPDSIRSQMRVVEILEGK